VDWIVDQQTDRNRVTPQTAEQPRVRMRQSAWLIYAHSDHSGRSKRMPWELGCFDSFRPAVAILPIVQFSRVLRRSGVSQPRSVYQCDAGNCVGRQRGGVLDRDIGISASSLRLPEPRDRAIRHHLTHQTEYGPSLKLASRVSGLTGRSTSAVTWCDEFAHRCCRSIPRPRTPRRSRDTRFTRCRLRGSAGRGADTLRSSAATQAACAAS
jgi:hypothetical protein